MPLPSSQLPQYHVVGFTGHRQLAEPARAEACVGEALTELARQAAGEWIGISSAASGSDLLFARRVLEAGLEWQALLPFPPVEFQRDFAAGDWKEVEALLARAGSPSQSAISTSQELTVSMPQSR